MCSDLEVEINDLKKQNKEALRLLEFMFPKMDRAELLTWSISQKVYDPTLVTYIVAAIAVLKGWIDVDTIIESREL